MCGITGGVWTDPRKALDGPVLTRMTDALAHRGPDGRGEFQSARQLHPAGEAMPGVALGHRRLAILDLPGGNQPMSNEDGTVWIVFNGEIYNFKPLRRQLEEAGHQFRSDCDTEVLVHLYEDCGPAMLGQLIGMFSFALWDARQARLLLARDRLGQKPLVYRHEPGRLLFASELKSLLAVPGLPRELDPQALDEYLTYQYVPHPRCIFQGYAKLPPGCYAIWEADRLEVHQYWQPDFHVEAARPFSRSAAELRALLTDSVRLRLQSDVPLGAFLSGGLDSTIIVGLMRELGAAPLRTFSIGFPIPEYDETRYARMAAERFQTEHEEFLVEPRAVDILPKLVWHYDEPFADSSAIPTWYVSELTRRHVTVALSGDGGDELFAGYPRYRAAWLGSWFDRLPRPVRGVLTSRVWQRLPASVRQKSLRRRFKRFVDVLGQSPARRYLEWIAIFGQARRRELYTGEFAAALPGPDPLEFLDGALARATGRGPVTATSLADLVTYLPCDLMTKVDIASMAHGLECRQPFLDHRVVELAAGMPVGHKFRFGCGKRLLLHAFADLLPGPIRRRRKMGFGVPLDYWFRNELRAMARDVLLDARTLNRGYFRSEGVRRLLDDHQQGRFDHAARLWSLLVLELWHRQWVDPPGYRCYRTDVSQLTPPAAGR